MGLSISPIQGFSMTAIQPLNFLVKNQADISDAYAESVQGADNSSLVNPVGYHTARKQTVELPELKKAQEASETNQAFNAIAAQYGNSTIGYSYAAEGATYGVTGSMFDALA